MASIVDWPAADPDCCHQLSEGKKNMSKDLSGDGEKYDGPVIAAVCLGTSLLECSQTSVLVERLSEEYEPPE